MKKGISLIVAEKSRSKAAGKFKKKLNLIAALIAMVFIVVTGLTIIVFTSYSKELQANEIKTQEIKKQIKEMEKFEIYVATIVSRLEGIEKVNKIRFLPSKLMADISILFSDGFEVQNLDLSANKVVLSGVCNDIVSITRLNESTENLKAEKKFPYYSFYNITRNESGEYNLSLTLYR